MWNVFQSSHRERNSRFIREIPVSQSRSARGSRFLKYNQNFRHSKLACAVDEDFILISLTRSRTINPLRSQFHSLAFLKLCFSHSHLVLYFVFQRDGRSWATKHDENVCENTVEKDEWRQTGKRESTRFYEVWSYAGFYYWAHTSTTVLHGVRELRDAYAIDANVRSRVIWS